MDKSSIKLFKVLTAIQKEKFDAAIPLLDKLIAKKPDEAELYNLKGTCFSRIGNNEEALLCYEKAIKQIPTSATYWNNKGLVLQNLGQQSEAEAAYEHALTLDSNLFLAIYNLGNLFIESDPDRARVWYERALALDPGHHLTLLNLGYLCAESGEYTLSEEYYRKAMEAKNRYAAAAFYRGDLAERQGNIELAITWYEQALDWDPKYLAADERLSKIMVPADNK